MDMKELSLIKNNYWNYSSVIKGIMFLCMVSPLDI